MLRDVDTRPALFHADEVLDGVIDARDLTRPTARRDR
jgi:hypothetical protein